MTREIHLTSKIYLAGHSGMVGSAILSQLLDDGYNNIITRSSSILDLTNQRDVYSYFEKERPDVVILAAAKVGGIQANIDNPASFLIDNLQIQNNVISASLKYNTQKFIFLGSSCIYPKECRQPMREGDLLTGKLEPTNEGYAIAKIAGIKLLEGMYKQYGFNSISLVPCNLYGPNDSFDLKNAHVLSALVKRFVDAMDNKDGSITLWGTGDAKREFMHVGDLAKAVLHLMRHYHSPEFINIGSGYDVSIKELAKLIANEVGFKGEILWDISKPNGMLRKCMDISNMKKLGFEPTIGLETGIREMIAIYNKIKNTI
jgi:GDP-L-fucose synthase